MEKPTKRKAFNFLRSYFDVMNELDKDSDKLDFLLAIIDKQFLDEDPKDLNFIVNLCYSSQKHAIESSVKGWKRAANTDLIGNVLDTPPTTPPTNPPTPIVSHPTTDPKEEEEEEEVKGEEEEVHYALSLENHFNNFWNVYNKKVDSKKCKDKFLKLKDSEVETILNVVQDYVRSTPEIQYRKNPLTWINGKCWNDEIKEPILTKQNKQDEITNFTNAIRERQRLEIG
jgi:hypothetical protein